MVKSQNENTPLRKLRPFKLAKGINDITKSRIANVTNTILNNDQESFRLGLCTT